MSLPLTEGQKQVWVVTQLDADSSSAYNERAAIVLRGDLDVMALRQAAQVVVDRHEALRTVIDAQAACQYVLPAPAIELPVHDLTCFSPEEQAQQLQQWQTDSIQQPFDLIRGPLVRFDIVKRAHDNHIFFITLHHIVTDGWSIGVMLRELGQFYRAAQAGSVLQLEPPLQYRDYVAWLHQQGSVFAANEAYWLEQFATRPPALNLPADRPRLAATGNRGERYTFVFNAQFHDQLHKLGRRMGCTLFMALLGGYAALLHRLTEQDDIVIGTPIADRGLEGSEGLLGYCLHLAPFRSTISDTTTIQTFFQAIRAAALSLYDHAAFSLTALLDKLPPGGAAGQPTLISTIFNLDRTLRVLPFGNVDATFKATSIAHVKFDLSVTIVEVNSDLCLDIDYNSELFEQCTIARMAEQFAILLNAFSTQPEQRLKDVCLLTSSERQTVLERWNATATATVSDMALHRFFEAQAARTPHATALVFGDRSLSYAALNSRANQLARALQRQGVRAEVPVGICMDRSLDVVIAILGILKAGGAYVPLDPSYPLERLTFIANHARLPLVIAHQGTRTIAAAPSATCFYLDDQRQALAALPAGNLPDDIAPEQTCYVIYTSGSTGQPKGVQAPHRGACNLTTAQIDTFGIIATSRVLQFAALGFDAAVSEIFTTLCAGATLYLAPQDDLLPGPELIDLIRKAHITIITLPPSVLAALPPAALQSVTTLVSAFRTEQIEDIYELSSAQRGMLFQSIAARQSEIFVEQFCCYLRGWLDTAAFQQGWERVLARHTALRTSFHLADLDKPLQVVNQHVALPWVYGDWRALPADARQTRLAALRAAERARPFSLEDAPLMRLILTRLADDRYAFTWTHHHLLMDGWSLPVVIQEVLAHYDAIRSGMPVALEPALDYGSYIAWLQQQDPAEAQDYWARTLAKAQTPITLVEAAESDARAPGYGEQQALLDAETTARIEALAPQGLLASTLIFGMWGLLLSSYAGTPDVVFGSTVAGRPAGLPGATAAVGLFINTLPVRIQAEPGQALRTWLDGIQQAQMEMRQYEHISLADIIEAAHLPRGLPLFQGIVVIENYPFDVEALAANPALSLQEFDVIGGKTHYPLTLMIDLGRQWSLRIIYDQQRFSEATARAIVQDMRAVLGWMVDRLDQPGAVLPALAAAPLLRRGPRHEIRPMRSASDLPATPIESLIAAIWEELLDVDTIGRHENFVDLGGHSLVATQIVSRIREQLQIDLTLRDLFERGLTIASLAEVVDEYLITQASSADVNLLLEELSDLSDDEIAEMLVNNVLSA